MYWWPSRERPSPWGSSPARPAKRFFPLAQVVEALVEMRAVAGLVGKGLRHEGRDEPELLGDVLRQVAKEDVAVAHGERVRVREVELELAVPVLVVERVDVPAEPVHQRHHAIEEREAAQERAHVVAGLGERVGRIRDDEASVLELEDVDLALDAEVHAEAHLGRLGEHALQRDARVQGIGLAVEVVVGRQPRDLGPPRQLDQALDVRHRADLVVVRRLAEPVERVAGEELRAGHHVLEVGDRHALRLRVAVDVDVGADAVGARPSPATPPSSPRGRACRWGSSAARLGRADGREIAGGERRRLARVPPARRR